MHNHNEVWRVQTVQGSVFKALLPYVGSTHLVLITLGFCTAGGTFEFIAVHIVLAIFKFILPVDIQIQ